MKPVFEPRTFAALGLFCLALAGCAHPSGMHHAGMGAGCCCCGGAMGGAAGMSGMQGMSGMAGASGAPGARPAQSTAPGAAAPGRLLPTPSAESAAGPMCSSGGCGGGGCCCQGMARPPAPRPG